MGFWPRRHKRSIGRTAEESTALEASRSLAELPGFLDPVPAVPDVPERGAWTNLGPAAVLAAQEHATPFVGRHRELRSLTAWLDDPAPVSSLRLAGAAGTGKTRLAMELARRLEANAQRRGQGWRAALLRPDQGSEVLTSLRRADHPIAILVDDALAVQRDGRIAQGRPEADLAALERAVRVEAASARGRAIVRILIVGGVALEAGRTPAYQASGTPRPASPASPIGRLELSRLELSSSLQRRIFQDSLARYATGFNVPVPDVQLGHNGEAATVLAIRATALAVILRARKGESVGSAAVVPIEQDHEVLTQLLAFECAEWPTHATASAGVFGPPPDEARLRVAVAVAGLLGASDAQDASRTLHRLPLLSNVPADAVDGIVRWLYGAFPAERNGRPRILDPGPLLDCLIGSELSSCEPAAIKALLADASDVQAEHALAVLTRPQACCREATAPLLSELLAARPGLLCSPAAYSALRTNDRTLADLVADQLVVYLPNAADLTEFARLAAEFSAPSAELAKLFRVLTVEPGLRSVRAGNAASAAAAALELAAYSEMLDRDGRRENSLLLAESAVRLLRVADSADPGPYRPQLAKALAALCVELTDDRRAEDGRMAATEASTLLREAGSFVGSRYRAPWAGSLVIQSAVLFACGRHEAGRQAGTEAIALLRELNLSEPDRWRQSLAGALAVLGAGLVERGQDEEALPLQTEAVDLLEAVNTPDSTRHAADLGASLCNAGAGLRRKGGDAGVPLQMRGVESLRKAYAAAPDRYRAHLATALGVLATSLVAVGRDDAALFAKAEAASLLRKSADAEPRRYRTAHARALVNLGSCLAAMAREEEALPILQQAAAFLKAAYAIDARSHRADLARTLINLRVCLMALGLADAAASAGAEAADLLRKASDEDPAYREELADVLAELALSARRSKLGSTWVQLQNETVALRRLIAEDRTDKHRRDLAKSLADLSAALTAVQSPVQARTVNEEAMAIYRSLAHSAPPVHARTAAAIVRRAGFADAPLDDLRHRDVGCDIRRASEVFAECWRLSG